MVIKPIRNDADHDVALKRIEELWDAPKGSEAGDDLEVLVVLVDDYENKRWPMTASADPVVDNLPPVHPGEILADQLEALNLSAQQLALHIAVPPNAITDIINGQSGISAAMSIRLGKAFGTGGWFWMNLQGNYEYKKAIAVERDVIEPLVPQGNRSETENSIPNEETIAAMAELEQGKGKQFETVEDLMADLERDESGDKKAPGKA